MEVVANNYLPGDQRLVDKIVYELKAQGIFDQFRKECFADVDTKPAYQNLRQRVENNVTGFLKEQSWRPDMNKNQVREMLRKRITESGYLETGVERIVDQVVNPKINSVFLPKVEEVVYKYLGIEKPNRDNKDNKNNNENNDTCNNINNSSNNENDDSKSKIKSSDLLPQDLEAVSPESDQIDKKDDKINSNDNTQDLDDSKMDEDESPPFEPLEEQSVYNPQEENSIDSHMSGFSGLISHESNVSSDNKQIVIDLNQQDSQLSRNSSESHLSIVTSDDNSKMDISDDTQTKTIHKIDDNKMKIDKIKRIDKKDDKDRDRDRERKTSTSSSSKDSKSRHSSSHSSRDRDRNHKESKSSSSSTSSSNRNDKDRSRDKDKKSSSSSSSSSKYNSSKDKDRNRKESSSRDRERDKNRSSGHHEKDTKKSSDSTKKSEKSRKDDKSSSHSSDRHKKDKEKERKKETKSKDDHYSSRDRKNDRRSTDRDSNGGTSSSSNNNNTSNNNDQSNRQTNDTNSNDFKNNSGDSNNSEQKDAIIEQNRLKLLKPKFASNIKEAMKLMKIRKQLAKLEKQNQLSLASVDCNSTTLLSSSISLDDIKPNGFLKKIEEESVVISQANWDRMEAKLNAEISKNYYGDDGDVCRYFNNENNEENTKFLQIVDEEIRKFNEFQSEVLSRRRKLHQTINNNNNQMEYCIKKRKIDKSCSEIIQQTVESFSLPLSPAESDNSIDRKEATPPLKPKRNNANKNNNQRYSSDDLYKPRPTFISSRRRGAKTLDN